MQDQPNLDELGPEDFVCRVCKKVKHVSAYRFVNNEREVRCRTCYNKYNREYLRQRRSGRPNEDSWANNLWGHYRIWPEDYEAMREAQDRRCAICKRHEDELPSRNAGRPRLDGSASVSLKLVVDHCHDSLKVRGLLCPNCNHALGGVRDDPVVARAAAQYLEAGGGPKRLTERPLRRSVALAVPWRKRPRRTDMEEIRQWGKDQGLKVSKTGRVYLAVQQAYDRAHGVIDQPPPDPTLCPARLHDITDPSVLYTYPSGQKRCKPCHAMQMAASRQKQSEKTEGALF